MPPAYTAVQKSAITNFVSFTQVDRTTATRYLKTNGWNVENAVNAYFNSGSGNGPSAAIQSNISKLFDNYRDEPQTKPDEIGVSGTMKYLEDLDVAIDDIGMLLVSELVQSPSMGVISRDGFVAGWAAQSCDTVEKQKQHVTSVLSALPGTADTSRFVRIYKHTFPLARPADQKSLPLDDAIEYWRLLFGSPFSPVKWSTEQTPWLDWWIEFLQTKWKKSINKDLWEQTYKFADMCLKDNSLKWWSEESAWPGVVDEFVEWVGEKRGVGTEEMEVE